MSKLVGALLALSLVVAGCGPDPIEKYFDSVESITRTMQRESIAALPDPAAITWDGIAAVMQARQTAVDSLDTLVPPNELGPEHTALLAALRDLTAAGNDFLAQTEDLPQTAFVEALEATASIDQIANRVVVACDAMQRQADSLGYTAAFSC